MLITWKVNVYTCAEIYLIINNVQKFNNHTKPTSKYLECWSCDKEANTANAGHGLVTFIDVDTGFQDFFKPLMDGYIHIIDINLLNHHQSESKLLLLELLFIRTSPKSIRKCYKRSSKQYLKRAY